jgi:periplasmic divalent cation tolerance protein
MIFLYLTNPDKKTAEKIGLFLLKKKLVGCVNIFPITSLYWWQGKIEKTKEWVLIAKTLAKNYQKIKQEIKSLHPYTVPCLLCFKVNPNQEYLQWLKKEVS